MASEQHLVAVDPLGKARRLVELTGVKTTMEEAHRNMEATKDLTHLAVEAAGATRALPTTSRMSEREELPADGAAAEVPIKTRRQLVVAVAGAATEAVTEEVVASVAALAVVKAIVEATSVAEAWMTTVACAQRGGTKVASNVGRKAISQESVQILTKMMEAASSREELAEAADLAVIDQKRASIVKERVTLPENALNQRKREKEAASAEVASVEAALAEAMVDLQRGEEWTMAVACPRMTSHNHPVGTTKMMLAMMLEVVVAAGEMTLLVAVVLMQFQRLPVAVVEAGATTTTTEEPK